MNDDGYESSWMSTWQGNENEGSKEDEGDFPGIKGQIGDWSSFYCAMDDEDGQELHRSLSSMNIKFKQQGGQPLQNQQHQLQPHPYSLAPNEQTPNKLKGSSGMSAPGSPMGLKGSTGIASPLQPTTTTFTNLKGSFGIQNNNNSNNSNNTSSPPPTTTSSLSSSPSTSSTKLVIGSSKISHQQKHIHHQFSKNGTSNLAASIVYDGSVMGGSGGIPNNSSTSSPSSGSPITPPISLSGSPNLHGIPKIQLDRQPYGSSPNSSMASSPPLSSSKETEPSFLTNLFGRKKKEKSFQSNINSGMGSVASNHTGSSQLSPHHHHHHHQHQHHHHHHNGISFEINDGSSTLSSNTQFSYADDDDLLSVTSGLELSTNSDKIFEGWVEIYVSKKWKKKWCVLRGSYLEYYKGWWEDQQPGGGVAANNNNSTDEESGKILLNYWYSFSKPGLVDGKFHFSIIQSSEVEKSTGISKNSKIKFRTEEEHIAKKWIDECEKVIKKRKETTVTLRPLAEHKSGGGILNIGRGRSNTVSIPSFEPPVNDFKMPKVCIPNELVDCLEADEKILLEKVKLLLDEFPPKPLPPGETPASYRAKPRSSDGYYRVLSLDGGGLRSVMVCILIERIAKRYPKFLDHIDVFTGTSAGSIVAAGLALEYPPKGTRRVLELTALPVFGKKRPGFNMGNAKYFARVLRASCYVFFQDRKFYEAQRKLVVPAFQLDCQWPPESAGLAPEVRRWQPRVFHNIGKCEGYLETDVIGDVLLRSASAPTYFPSYQGYIDGGVFANNPALSAITLAMSPSLDQIPADKIICLSIGTGLSSHYMEGGQDYDWGLLNWAPKLGNLLMGSQVDYLTQLCENMLGSRFHRLNPELGDNTSMDDPKLVTELATLANTIDLTKTFEFIEKYFILPEDKVDDNSSGSFSPRPSTTTTNTTASPTTTNHTAFNSSTGSSVDSPRQVSPRVINTGSGNLTPRNISPRNLSIPHKNFDEDTSILLTPR